MVIPMEAIESNQAIEAIEDRPRLGRYSKLVPSISFISCILAI